MLVYPPLVIINNINYLNKIVFTVNTVCLKAICIYHLDTFVKVGVRYNHYNCPTQIKKKKPCFQDFIDTMENIDASLHMTVEECGCSVVKCLTRDQGVAASSLARGTALWP